MAFNAKQFILQERAKGTPDDQIFDSLQEQSKPIAQRTGAGELLPTAFAIGGGVLGAFGGPVGAIGGATAGGALGETIQQGIEKKFGEREQISAPQIVGSGVTSGAFQATGGVVAKGLGAFGRFAASKVKQPLISLFKNLSGFTDEVITKALERKPSTISGLKGGERTFLDVVRNSVTGLSELSKKSVREASEELTKIVKDTPLSPDSLLARALSSSASKFKSARTEIFNKVGDFTNKIATNLRRKHNIGVEKTGNLSFARPNQPSRIVSGSEQSAIRESFNLLKEIRGNLSLKHVDSVYGRLVVLKSKTPAGTPTGTETKAVIGGMIKDLTDFVKKVYPKSYTEFLEKNLQKRVFINEAQEILGGSAHPSPKDLAIIESRVLQLFNTGKLPVREALEKIGGEVGEDIVGTTAGTLLSTGGQVSSRAINLTKRGLVEKVLESIPREALTNFIKTGNLTGELSSNQILINTAKTLGISVKALLLEAVNLSTTKTVR